MSGVLCPDCEGVFPSSEHLCGLKLLEFVHHSDICSRMPNPSALRPCNCGLLDLLGKVDNNELQKRENHPEYGPFPVWSKGKRKG